MLRLIYLVIFKFMGWKIEGKLPHERKYIIAVAPHTSNWDFVIGVMARSILCITNARFLGKDSLFKPPFGWIFKAFGGYPVNRSKNQDMVQQVVAIFQAHDDFILALAPEGTRKKVAALRTGFYYISKYANVPIVPVGFDFSRKSVVLGEKFIPSGKPETDMEVLMSFYRSIRGKNPKWGL